jgi:DNA-binding NtrC family response regulator
LNEFNQQNQTQKKLGDEVIDMLNRYDWPGNVRELRNVLQRAFILAEERITVDTLPREVRSQDGSATGPYLQLRIGSSLDDAQRRLVLATLEEFDGDRKRAARALGVSMKTLATRLKEYRDEA